MTEEIKHLRALVYKNCIKDVWGQYLPLVQRIIKYSIVCLIGTKPAHGIQGDLEETRLGYGLSLGVGRPICRSLFGQAPGNAGINH
jgi:hypothetical protein